MSKTKPLTKDELLVVLKQMKLATKEDVLASERRLKLRIGKVNNDLAQRIANVATDSPSYKEFEKLKQKVEARFTS